MNFEKDITSIAENIKFKSIKKTSKRNWQMIYINIMKSSIVLIQGDKTNNVYDP